MTAARLRGLLARHRGAVLAMAAALTACVGLPLMVAHQRPAAPAPARAAITTTATPDASPATTAATAPTHPTASATVPRYTRADPFRGAPAAATGPRRARRHPPAAPVHPKQPAAAKAPASQAPVSTATTAAQAPAPAAAVVSPARVAVYGADVRLSRVGTVAPLLRDLPRLAVLGRHASPVAVFAGLRPDHRAAAFVLGPGVAAPAAHCAVPATSCRIVVVPAGRRVRLRGAGDATYWLRLRRITVRRVPAPVAAKARQRVSVAGRCYLGALGIADLRTGADGVDIRWADRATPCR